MGYYDSVYLNRINKYGYGLQERIINKKEHDFDHFVQKSPNKVVVYKSNDKFEGVLQTKEYNEIETVDYFLTYVTIPINTGDILEILDISDPTISHNWIVIAIDNFVSAGYNRYTVVKMDREVRWITHEGALFKGWVHISGGGANARDDRIISKYKTRNEAIVFLPNENITLTMQDCEAIQRGVRVNIKDQVWRLSGKNNVTTDGVAYVTLEQDYTSDEDNDKELTKKYLPDSTDDEEALPNVDKLGRWEFNTSLREVNGIITLQKNSTYSVIFSATYFGAASSEKLNIFVKSGKNNIEYDPANKSIVCKKNTETPAILRIEIENSPDVYKEYKIVVVDNSVSTFSVEGPTRLKVGYGYELESEQYFGYNDTEINKDLIKIEGIGQQNNSVQQFYKKYKITFVKITKNPVSITFKNEDDDTYTLSFISESPWIGG